MGIEEINLSLLAPQELGEDELAILKATPLQPYSECLRSPVFVALMEWNSRIGVPADVWMMAFTSVIWCSRCGRFRTNEAFWKHTKSQGSCAAVLGEVVM